MMIIFALAAAIIHVWIFIMESFLWGTPKMNKIFKVSKEEASMSKAFAYNQGFYNLFLSIAIFFGFYATQSGHGVVGTTLVVYSCCSMVAASLVLLKSNKKLIRGALIQGGAPLVALVLFGVQFF